MSNLVLTRPLVVFDIESTGTNRRTDRIIDLALIRLLPDGRQEEHVFRVNPGVPIPAEATAVHGITDEDVKNHPSFKEVAPRLAELLQDCDLAGFNVVGFDIPMLEEEFQRAGVPFNMLGRRVIDAQRVFHRKVPRDLTAAVAYYTGGDHPGAHGAMADTQATLRVLEAQLERYPDLPREVDGLDAFCRPREPGWADREGKLKWVEGQLVLNFGKHQGRLLREMAREEPGFLKWMLKGDFTPEVKDIVRNALAGYYPAPPPTEKPIS